MPEIADGPRDVVSSLAFSSGNQLLTTSWDNQMRLYDCKSSPSLVTSIDTPITALSTIFNSGMFHSGYLDGSVRSTDLENHSLVTLKPAPALGESVSAGVAHLISQTSNSSALIAGAWDGHVTIIDPRAAPGASEEHSFKTPHKLFAIASCDRYLVVGMALRAVHIYDHRDYLAPVQVRESGLKLQVRDLTCWDEGYALASIDGRVAIEYFDPSEAVQAQKYAFKCHRVVGNIEDEVFPVNTARYNPQNRLLYTGGNDTVCLWDFGARKRIKQYKFEREVSNFAISDDGSLLAVATTPTSEPTILLDARDPIAKVFIKSIV